MNLSKFNRNNMSVALEEAEKAYNLGEVPVGCVVIDKNTGQLVAKAHNLMQINKNPNAHAEMLAINEACIKIQNKNLSTCDIYTTLEPCAMCAAAISNARIGKLYYGSGDIRQGAIENTIRLYTNSKYIYKPEVYPGLGENESQVIIKKFFTKLRQN